MITINDYHVLKFLWRIRKFHFGFFLLPKFVIEHRVVHVVVYFLPVWEVSV